MSITSICSCYIESAKYYSLEIYNYINDDERTDIGMFVIYLETQVLNVLIVLVIMVKKYTENAFF